MEKRRLKVKENAVDVMTCTCEAGGMKNARHGIHGLINVNKPLGITSADAVKA